MVHKGKKICKKIYGFGLSALLLANFLGLQTTVWGAEPASVSNILVTDADTFEQKKAMQKFFAPAQTAVVIEPAELPHLDPKEKKDGPAGPQGKKIAGVLETKEKKEKERLGPKEKKEAGPKGKKHKNVQNTVSEDLRKGPTSATWTNLADQEQADSQSLSLTNVGAQSNRTERGDRAINSEYAWPVLSRYITSPFGSRLHPIYGVQRMHYGIDIGQVGYNSKVTATQDGVVLRSVYDDAYGNYVLLSHGSGKTSLYAHLSSRKVKAGETVRQGDMIGITGSTGNSTGPHLHFELRENNVRIDPLRYLSNYIRAW